jgi:serine/threonine protein kinase
MPKQIQISEVQKTRMSDPSVIPEKVSLNGRDYTVERPVGSGFKSVVWKVVDSFAMPWALKLCIHEDYQSRSYMQEVSRAAMLRSYPEFAQINDAGIVEITLKDDAPTRFVAFLEEWVEGETLKKFILKHPEQMTPSFLIAYVGHLCEALAALEATALRHDDLHADNVMICPPPPGSLSRGWGIKVIDTGSLKPASQTLHKPKDDHRHFVDHLVTIWNAIQAQHPGAARDRRFLSDARGLLKSMLESDLIIALRDPMQTRNRFTEAYTRANLMRQEQELALSSPFEFISAEHIANDQLLVDIFAKTCPWLGKVAGPDPCLVTGPRGCGKSTIFRWLSLKAHLHKPFAEISENRIAGFYLSCSIDLQNRLSWIKSQALAERFRADIIHYFNLLAAREIVSTLALIAERPDRETFFGFGPSEEAAIHKFVMDSVAPTASVRLQGSSRLAQAREAVEREMFATHAQMLRGLNKSPVTPESFLGDLTQLMASKIPYFSRKKIAFLLDDFSVHRLPVHVQIVLNRVIWERRPSHVFKLSCEKYGAALTDSFKATADVTREMKEVDCGREYLALDDIDQSKKGLAFAIELLDNRLRAAGYKGTANTLIGESKWKEKSLAMALKAKPPGRKEGHYHGMKTISHLCSGDVSSLLLVYSRIFESGNVTRDSVDTVDAIVQDRAIIEVSRKLFEAIKPSVPYGSEMYAVVNAFGQLVRNVLQRGRPQHKGKQVVPSQIPRIEIDQIGGGAVDTLNPAQQEIARELVRRAIFIEMEPGLSRHANITTLRWHLRRIYLPTFGAALAKNNAVKQKPDWFKYFLSDPDGACALVWNSWPKHSKADEEPPPLLREIGKS